MLYAHAYLCGQYRIVVTRMKMYNDFTVVLPTLNEEKNIGVLIHRLLREYKGIRVVVVDDGSRDGTAGVVKKIGKSHGSVEFVDRAAQGRERGLTASAIDGISSSRTKFVIVMDADLQHPAEVVGKLAGRLASGSGLTVAVRADVRGWEAHRKLISKTLMSMGYAILIASGRERCKDIFSGFFGVDKKLFIETLEANKGRFVYGGYKILFDFLKCNSRGSLNISEVPYSFGLRKHGASKAGIKQGMLLFKSLLT